MKLKEWSSLTIEKAISIYKTTIKTDEKKIVTEYGFILSKVSRLGLWRNLRFSMREVFNIKCCRFRDR